MLIPLAKYAAACTVNFAARRGIELDVDDDVLRFFEAGDDSEPMFTYRMGADGLHYKGNIRLPNSIKEELPAWMPSEKVLRQMIEFVSSEMGTKEKQPK